MDAVNFSVRVPPQVNAPEQVAAVTRNVNGTSSNELTTRQVPPLITNQKSDLNTRSRALEKRKGIAKYILQQKTEQAEVAARVQVMKDTSRDRLEEISERLNQYSQSIQRDLVFSVEEETTIIKVLDRTTQELIRQIPPELALDLAHTFERSRELNLIQVRV